MNGAYIKFLLLMTISCQFLQCSEYLGLVILLYVIGTNSDDITIYKFFPLSFAIIVYGMLSFVL